MASYVASVGMEVHAELATRSKMFCRCQVGFGGEVNTRTCPVCLGLPGALPVANREAVHMVLKTALALNCHIARRSIFHRKNYFYPDLPKGYQISQYGETNPIGYSGYLDINLPGDRTKRIKIRRVHLEEDTAKILRLPSGGQGVDFNRAGVPLMEIVTDFPPDIETAEEAKEYLSQLRLLLIYLGVCDGRMEQGSLRCEPNISIRPEGSSEYGIKTELKNLGSFKAVQLGIEREVERQKAVLADGGTIAQETRGWDEQTETSYLMRVKEEENDYRYFPDPDLVAMEFSEKTIEETKEGLPELPHIKFRRYRSDFGLSEYDAGLLIASPEWARWFEAAVEAGGDPKMVCNWMNSDFARLLNETGQQAWDSKVTPQALVELTKMQAAEEISSKIAKEAFEAMFRDGASPKAWVEARGGGQVSDADILGPMVQLIIDRNPDAVKKYMSGQDGVIGFLTGAVMKESKGSANPKLVQQLLREKLKR